MKIPYFTNYRVSASLGLLSLVCSLNPSPAYCTYLELESNNGMSHFSNGYANGSYSKDNNQLIARQSLNLSAKSKLSEEDFQNFSQTRYQKVDLGNSTQPKRMFALLAQQADLEELNLNKSNAHWDTSHSSEQALTKETLTLLSNLKNLRILRIAFQNIGDEELEIISSLFPSLELLDISHTKITDKGLKPLNALKNLRVLIASDTALSDEGIAGLNPSSLSRLEELNLRGTKVSENIFEYLPNFRSLKKADFRHTSFTKQWREKLRGPETLEEIYISAKDKEESTSLPSTIESMPRLKITYEPQFNFSWYPQIVLHSESQSNISSKDKY